MWNATKAILRGNFIAINPYIHKKKYLSDIILYHNILLKIRANDDQNEQKKIKIKVEIHEIRKIQKNNRDNQ